MEVLKIGKPAISIITPLYNGVPYIHEAAGSVLSQTFRDFEWIIVDDNSRDASLQMISDVSLQDPRIKIIPHSENRGPVISRNSAIQKAKGRYIAFLDIDDLWLPEKLEKQIEFMEKKNAHLSYTEYKKINANGTLKTGIQIKVPYKISYKKIIRSNSIMASSAMYDTRITGRVFQDPEIPFGKDDLVFFSGIIKDHGPAYGLKMDLARYRVHNDSITRDKLHCAREQWHLYRKILRLPLYSALYNYLIYAIKGFLKFVL